MYSLTSYRLRAADALRLVGLKCSHAEQFRISNWYLTTGNHIGCPQNSSWPSSIVLHPRS